MKISEKSFPKYGGKQKRRTWKKSRNTGFKSFRDRINRGLEIAFERGSKFVMLLNADTEIEEGMISELKRYCDDNTVVIPRIYSRINA